MLPKYLIYGYIFFADKLAMFFPVLSLFGELCYCNHLSNVERTFELCNNISQNPVWLKVWPWLWKSLSALQSASFGFLRRVQSFHHKPQLSACWNSSPLNPWVLPTAHCRITAECNSKCTADPAAIPSIKGKHLQKLQGSIEDTWLKLVDQKLQLRTRSLAA